MATIILIHRLLGGMVLPLLLCGTAIWFTLTWKPDTWPSHPARVIKVLVDLQFLLGLSFWTYLISVGAGARYLTFPFLLHPFLGLAAATLVHYAVHRRGLTARLGRWAPLVTFGLLVLLVLMAGRTARTG